MNLPVNIGIIGTVLFPWAAIGGCIAALGTKCTIELVNEAGEVVTADAAMTYGNFLQSIIDFLLIALSIFLVLRIIMNTQKKIESLKKKEEEALAAPTTKKCPFCCSEIALEAVRCPHCTSELPEEKAE